jgi:predicted HTH domain antitoxin
MLLGTEAAVGFEADRCSPTARFAVNAKSPARKCGDKKLHRLRGAAPLGRSPAELGRELKLAAAIHRYGRGLMSQERAAELSGMNRRDFVRALAREGGDVFILDDDSLARELGRDSRDPSSRQ